MEENRKIVADLLKGVRLGSVSVREALLAFPDVTDDRSIMAAYHALVHYEADEDLRKRDILYKEEQDDYIEFLFHILERGEDLPNNIVRNYEQYYKSANIPRPNNAKGFWQRFFRFLNV